ncbi:MAG: glycosyltransferase [candidate division Zixibacteria bacterium]|nr:glycosyltransferase [candidate division Zixibacteria bacterium]
MRVLLLADARAFHTERFARQLQTQGCDVLTASLENGTMEYHHLTGRGPVKSLHYLSVAPQLRRLIEQFQPDVINPHFASGYGFIAALARRGNQPPIVLNLWGSDILIVPRKSWLHKRKTRFALRAADYVIGDSEFLLSAAEELVGGIERSVIPWGIERRFLNLHKENYSFQKPLRIIVPRTQAPVYNNEFIVRALQPLIADGTVRLTFPSFGPDAARFRDVVAPYLDSGINLYDAMPREQFLAFMAQHDIYLSAARSDSSPASLIEAMALGLLPIVADIPGVREWLSDDNGRLFPQNDDDALRTIVTDIVRGDDSFADLRRHNFEKVQRDAIFEDNVATQLDIMRRLVDRSRQ